MLIGIVTYGVPPSNSLCKGIAGEQNKHDVLELNRLVIKPNYNGENYASYLVGQSLKMLPNHTFVVSYADTAWNHIGYVYQATNFIYTGLTKTHLDRYNEKGKHPRHYDKTNRLYYARSRKHRYIYLVGDKRTKKQMLKDLKYPIIQKYPKGNTQHYDINKPKTTIDTIVINRGKETTTNG